MGWAGDLSERSGDHETALHWWRLSAEQGDPSSAGQLGEAALRENDYAQARAWFELAADPVDEERDLVDVAPVPVFAGFERVDDRV